MGAWHDRLRELIAEAKRKGTDLIQAPAFRVLWPDGVAMIEATKRVNRQEYWGAEPGTLLCVGGRWDKVEDGTTTYEVTLEFAYRSRPWNEDQAGQYLRDRLGAGRYPEIDFSDAFPDTDKVPEPLPESWRDRPALL